MCEFVSVCLWVSVGGCKMKLASLLNWQAVARGFGGLALWRIRSESESSVGDGDRLPQAENLPSLITVIIIDLERGAPSTGVIRTRSLTPCSSAVSQPAEIEIFFSFPYTITLFVGGSAWNRSEILQCGPSATRRSSRDSGCLTDRETSETTGNVLKDTEV